MEGRVEPAIKAHKLVSKLYHQQFLEFFLHYSSKNSQTSGSKAVDLTQWHNYAVEWADGRVIGYLDGRPWFRSTDGSTLPPGRMHLAIQLDYFPDRGSPQPTRMDVDYARTYL